MTPPFGGGGKKNWPNKVFLKNWSEMSIEYVKSLFGTIPTLPKVGCGGGIKKFPKKFFKIAGKFVKSFFDTMDRIKV